ncbi:UDP-N-acetyl-D-glucosamine 6-dehydrogenase [Halomicronema hongdechloris C2206]|uniref:UDP-N-acetyl-D-glucosamine 6-dehydrogenase n=1 Tax=Halomicronema hongdechloris C2206 TaxID=1641165 RepID=A0A1Z3HRD5_9CYAN|nr:nucleotide sugar dehydrogenase [Halomicronema hongdechloris]ASC72884.1 UDP-N-acetyl-D-glucosamine 6-dehydrogenase [Halomicronema hongdechloris C2206]
MYNSLHQLREKILHSTCKIGVVGLGYVGLPFAVEKAKVGFSVIGVDRNSKRVAWVNQAHNYIKDVKDYELKRVVESGYFKAEESFGRLSEMDVIVICVPTPLTEDLTPDISYIEEVTQEIAKRLRPGQLISLESTTYPGTTDEVICPILERCSGLKRGKDFFLAYSPERIDPGNQRYTTKNINKVVSASDVHSLEVATLFYQQTIETITTISSSKVAELSKIFENTFRAVNIALVNELAMLCDRLDINVWEVIDTANTKPFGIMPFYPGPGVGGHCIPIDPHYLKWKAKDVNFNARFINFASEINRQMPSFVKNKAFSILDRLGIAPSVSRCFILGVTYKKDLPDLRESPAISIIKLLLEEKVVVSYYDPYIPKLEVGEHSFKSTSLTAENLSFMNLVIITTDHSQVDYEAVVTHAPYVLDTRGITRHLNCAGEKVTML